MNRAVFLDRDGTINVDYGYVHSSEKFQLLPGVEEGLLLLQNMGFKLIIITNQSGIGRGYFTENVYINFQNWIDQYLRKKGINITDYYYCPHIEENKCDCRKPKTRLFRDAAEKYNIDFSKSYVIGDKERDLKICFEENVQGFLISDDKNINIGASVKIVDSLMEAVSIINENN